MAESNGCPTEDHHGIEDLTLRTDTLMLREDSTEETSVQSEGLPTSLELRVTSYGGYGLFATRDLPRGTRIIAEPPMIHQPPGDKMDAVWMQLEALTPEQLNRYTELSSGNGTVGIHQRQMIKTRLANERRSSGAALEAMTNDMVKLHEIYFNNCVSMGCNERFGAGLFPLYSRINHSCLPNVQNSYNATLGKLTVHAIRDIKAGAELCTSYIFNLRTKEQRHEQLKNTWSFDCQCEVCDNTPTAFASEKRRQLMFDIDQALAAYEANIPFARALIPNAPRNGKEARELVERLVAVLREEGLVGMDLAQAYRECSKYSLQEGLIPKALAYAQKECEVEKVCIGSETDHLEKNMEGAVYWIKHLETLSEQDKVKARMNEKRFAKEQKKADKKAAKKAGKNGKGEGR
ncbi:TPR domain [Lecanosticta acicola]|uniref:TPR domain n=1 Tax=Lecanosticta acicola TaxID=111012 RepID=A0AAI8YU66_9PEZI|nr:TPR domain [Lecanosticta acicola]